MKKNQNQNQNRTSDIEIAERLRTLLAPPAAPVDKAERDEPEIVTRLLWPQGLWELSAIVNGERLAWRFQGHTARKATAIFRREINRRLAFYES